MAYIVKYYTDQELHDLFVENSVTGADRSINATSRILLDSNATTSINWDGREFLSGNNIYLKWNDGIGFFGSSTTAKPSGVNLISSITSLGLLSYTTPSGENLIASVSSVGLVAFTPPTQPNFVSSITKAGIINYTQPSGSNLAQSLTKSGIIEAAYSAPSGSNLINALS